MNISPSPNLISKAEASTSPSFNCCSAAEGICPQQADMPVSAVLQAESDLDDEMTFSGRWTDEVLARAGAYFDVPAAAVRRRMRG